MARSTVGAFHFSLVTCDPQCETFLTKKCQKSSGLHMRRLQRDLVLQESLLKDVIILMTLKVLLAILTNFLDEIKKKFEISGPASHLSLFKSDGTTEIDVGASPAEYLEGNSDGNPLIVKSVFSSQVSSLQNNSPSKAALILQSTMTTKEKESILKDIFEVQSKDREVQSKERNVQFLERVVQSKDKALQFQDGFLLKSWKKISNASKQSVIF